MDRVELRGNRTRGAQGKCFQYLDTHHIRATTTTRMKSFRARSAEEEKSIQGQPASLEGALGLDVSSKVIVAATALLFEEASSAS